MSPLFIQAWKLHNIQVYFLTTIRLSIKAVVHDLTGTLHFQIMSLFLPHPDHYVSICYINVISRTFIWHVKCSLILTSKLIFLWKIFTGNMSICEILNSTKLFLGKIFTIILSAFETWIVCWHHQCGESVTPFDITSVESRLPLLTPPVWRVGYPFWHH